MGRVNKQFQRKQQAGSERSQGVSKPIINRRLQIRPVATTPRPAQFANFAQPTQFAQSAQSAQPAQSAHAQALRDHQAQLQQFQLEQLHAQQQRQQIPFQRQQQFQQNIFVPQQRQQQQFQQNNFGPVSAPVQQAQAPSQFVASAGSASNINLNTGTYSISY